MSRKLTGSEGGVILAASLFAARQRQAPTQDRKPVTATAYAAVRKAVDSGREWFDISTISYLRDESQREATKEDQRVPGWAEANPVQRIAEFSLTESGTR